MSAEWQNSRDKLCVAIVLDALDGVGLRYQSPRIPIVPRTGITTLIGRCRTTLWMDFSHDDPDTYAMELAAVDDLKPGDVMVAATQGSRRSGIWGELLSTAAQARGAVGVVTDGGVRDVAQMTRMGFPVFSQHLSAYDSYNRQKVVARDVPVEIDGIAIATGDIIVADADGIAIVPEGVATAVLEAALAKVNKEDAFRDAVRDGLPILDAYNRFHIL